MPSVIFRLIVSLDFLLQHQGQETSTAPGERPLGQRRGQRFWAEALPQALFASYIAVLNRIQIRLRK